LFVRTLKLVVGIGVIVAAVYLAFQLVPPYFANYQFQDTIQNEAVLESYTSKSEEDIRQAMFKRAQELEIPIRVEQINVQRSGPAGSGGLTIWVDYSIHVDLPYYPGDLQFHSGSKNRPIPGA
jgi:hypothetical protein